MALRRIVTVGDDILRKKSRPVVNFDEKLAQLLDDMKETLAEADGAGLAAVQVGILRRAVIVDVGDEKGTIELINPEIVSVSEETQEEEEGCLSVPGEFGVVVRPKEVTVRAQDRTGKWVLHKGEGLKARCFCHELDHLDGKLYIDVAKHMLTKEEIEQMREERRQNS